MSTSSSTSTTVAPATSSSTITTTTSTPIIAPSTYGQATQSIIDGLASVNGLTVNVNTFASQVLAWATITCPSTQLGVVSSSVDIVSYACKMVEQMSVTFSAQLAGVTGVGKTQLAFACSRAFLYTLAQSNVITPAQYQLYCAYVGEAEFFESTASSIYNVVSQSAAFQTVEADAKTGWQKFVSCLACSK
jgi:hypothetical protein